MAAMDFPATPTVGQLYPPTPVPGVPQYSWDGTAWIAVLATEMQSYVRRAGDTMTGLLTLSGDPAVAMNAATKQYVDGGVAGVPGKVSKAGDTMTGPLVLPADPTLALQAATKQFVDTKVSKAGDTMTGHLALPPGPAAANAVRKDYVDGAVGAVDLSSRVAKAGDTMTGQLNVNSNIGATGNITASGSVGATGNVTAGNTLYSYYGLICQGYYGGYQVDAISAAPATDPMLISAIHIPGVRYQWRIALPSGNPVFDFYSDGSPVSLNGGAWLAYSDARIKTVLGDYASGLDQIAALQPVRYTFKGNNTDKPPDQPLGAGPDGKALPRTGDAGTAPYQTSNHYTAAIAETEYIGLIAQDTEGPMPETVKQSTGYIDGVEVADFRLLNTSPILFALINAVKELKERIEVLEAATAPP